mmetsp:Transcript_6119/g.15974  ORF Transcript_6119/g.15974 Transcript_6119/m.15974 type:complete len:383 (+) Transcript_6119:161-1309(+)
MNPVVQQDWKLCPPVMPSMSRSSPAKKSPSTRLEPIVRVSTSASRMPPAVTNSSLLESLPEKGRRSRTSRSSSARSSARPSSSHFLVGSIPSPAASSSPDAELATSTRHSRRGIAPWKGEMFPTCLSLWKPCVKSSSSSATSAGCRCGHALSSRLPLYPVSASGSAPNAERRSALGPETPRCVTSRGPRARAAGAPFFFFLTTSGAPDSCCGSGGDGDASSSSVSSASWRLTPASEASRSAPGARRNAKRLGRSGEGSCPSACASACEAEPVASTTAAQRTSDRAPSPPRCANEISNAPAGSAEMDSTLVPSCSCTPARSAAESRQSMIVPESSDSGNTRPSSSSLSETPSARNHSSVSVGENELEASLRPKQPISSCAPRG